MEEDKKRTREEINKELDEVNTWFEKEVPVSRSHIIRSRYSFEEWFKKIKEDTPEKMCILLLYDLLQSLINQPEETTFVMKNPIPKEYDEMWKRRYKLLDEYTFHNYSVEQLKKDIEKELEK